MSFTPQWIFLVLGPLFLCLGLVRCLMARELVPQARAWLAIGVLFSAVATWLWWPAFVR